jgi:MFS family permease
VALALFYVTIGIPVSALADRFSRRNIISGALLLWSGLTILTGLSSTFGQMLLARIGVGIGESGERRRPPRCWRIIFARRSGRRH